MSKKNYLEDVSYPEFTPDKPKKIKEAIFPEPEKFNLPIKEAWRLIEQIQTGSTNLVPHAINFPKGRCPAVSCLEAFEKFPTEENLKQFILLCTQDFNWLISVQMASFFSDIYPKVRRWVRED